MKNVQKIILYLTSVLLLGCLGWIFIHAVCAVPQAKNIFKDKNMLPVIMAGTLFLLLLFCEKAVLFSRGLRAAMRHGKAPDAAQIAAFCVWFFVVSTALLLLLLAAGAAAQWL